MIKGREAAKDSLKALGIGMAAAIAAALVLFAGGMIFGKAGLNSGLEVMKNGLLIIFSLSLFLIAGMLLTSGKKPEQFKKGNGWKDHFAVLGPRAVLGLISVDFLILAAIADYFLII